MRGAVAILLRGAILVYIGVCGVLFFFQRSYLYYPQPATLRSDVTIALPTQSAHVLVSTRPHDGPKAFVYFGGNAEDVAYDLPSFSDAMPDRAIYLLHYRGYGGSSGSPSEAGLFEDGLTLFDEVQKSHREIEVVGRSLGSGVAVYVAGKRPAARLVLVTPYDSIEELAARQFPYVPVKWMLFDRFQSSKYAPLVNAPTRIIAAEHDQVVPRDSTERLLSRFKPGVASFTVLPGTDHNTISDHPDYLRLLN